MLTEVVFKTAAECATHNANPNRKTNWIQSPGSRRSEEEARDKARRNETIGWADHVFRRLRENGNPEGLAEVEQCLQSLKDEERLTRRRSACDVDIRVSFGVYDPRPGVVLRRGRKCVTITKLNWEKDDTVRKVAELLEAVAAERRSFRERLEREDQQRNAEKAFLKDPDNETAHRLLGYPSIQVSPEGRVTCSDYSLRNVTAESYRRFAALVESQEKERELLAKTLN